MSRFTLRLEARRLSRSHIVLVVDERADNLRVLTSMLKDQGYNVRKALNGQMALTACQAVLPDLILLDINMPGIGGYQVCACLKADRNELG